MGLLSPFSGGSRHFRFAVPRGAVAFVVAFLAALAALAPLVWLDALSNPALPVP